MKTNPKNIPTIILLYFATMNSFAQISKNNAMHDLENIKGKVKYIQTTSDQYDNKIYLDKNGHITRRETTYSGRTSINKDYSYDEKGRLISYQHYDEYKPDLPVAKMVYKYDKKGQLISFGSLYSDTYRYEYDNKGNRVLEIRNGGTKVKKTYNEKNQLIEELDYSDTYEKQHVWGTNNNGEYFEKDVTIAPHNSTHTIYTHNKFEDISSITQKLNNITTTTTINYEYDQHQNWIVKNSIAQVRRDGKIEQTVTRKITRLIEYYE